MHSCVAVSTGVALIIQGFLLYRRFLASVSGIKGDMSFRGCSGSVLNAMFKVFMPWKVSLLCNALPADVTGVTLTSMLGLMLAQILSMSIAFRAFVAFVAFRVFRDADQLAWLLRPFITVRLIAYARHERAIQVV